MVESNLQHSVILPSEKAFAYKMRLEALKRQGKRSGSTCEKCLERDMSILLKDMQTRKNLLCFIPYRFSFDPNSISHSDGQTYIANAVANDYGILFEYRNKKQNNLYETFISFIYDGSMTILGMKNGILDIVDEIPLKSSKTYLDLSKYLG